MANTPSAKKRARQNKTNRERNIALKNRMRTSVKRVLNATSEGNAEEASSEYVDAITNFILGVSDRSFLTPGDF